MCISTAEFKLFENVIADCIVDAITIKGFTFREKDTWQAAFLRRNNLYEKRLAEIVTGYLKDLKVHVLGNLIKSVSPHITKASARYNEIMQWEFNRDIWDAEINKLIKNGLRNVVETEGNVVTRRMQRLGKYPTTIGFDVRNPNVEAFCRTYAYKCAASVNGTITESIRSIIQVGMETGSSITEIRAALEYVFDDRTRAEMIARTESIRASNYAANESYRQSGVVEYKEWLITDDDRTCEYCLGMDGTKIALDGNFNAKAEELGLDLSYGDIESPPAHVNCRCCLTPVVMEFETD